MSDWPNGVSVYSTLGAPPAALAADERPSCDTMGTARGVGCGPEAEGAERAVRREPQGRDAGPLGVAGPALASGRAGRRRRGPAGLDGRRPGGLDLADPGRRGWGGSPSRHPPGGGVPLVRVRGRGGRVLADDADGVHLVPSGGPVTANGCNLVAFDAALAWGTRRVEGASVLAGDPLQRGRQRDRPGRGHRPRHARGADGGRADGCGGAGGAFQLAFSGTGFVVVQASEGRVVPPHSH
jgi:hypothetical protein